MGLGLWTALSGGCLVTDQITFDEEPIEPPEILDSPTSPRQMSRPFWVEASSMMWPMQVLVREKDPNRDLVAHFRIVKPKIDDLIKSPPPFDSVDVPKGGIDPELRELKFDVHTDRLDLGRCHRLELAVSGHFDPKGISGGFFSYTLPGYEDDLATAAWLVLEGDSDLPDPDAKALLDSCDADVDLLEPMTLGETMP